MDIVTFPLLCLILLLPQLFNLSEKRYDISQLNPKVNLTVSLPSSSMYCMTLSLNNILFPPFSGVGLWLA